MTATVAKALQRRRRNRWPEECIRISLFSCAFLSIGTTVGIIAVLATEASHFFREVGVFEFLFGTEWSPLIKPYSFGVLPLVCGTFLIVLGSSIIAIPVGLASAIYLSEYASSRVRDKVKPILEVLAGIPTIVYGYFALTFVTPILKSIFPSTGVFNAASGAIVVGIMILPMVASLCDDALRAVPASLRHGAFALGATRSEVSLRVVLPAALSGITASFVLAISRAVGETMAVTLAAGQKPNLTFNPLEAIETMTAYIVQVMTGDVMTGSIQYYSLFAVGSLLFLITLGANVIANRIMRKYREVYE